MPTLNLGKVKGDTGPQGPAGATGAAGPANTLTVDSVTTGAAGSSASVVLGGTAPNQTISFTIPRGDTGATGSSGAVSLLTGFASAAGTVAGTDTVLAAVGKLDGNIALRATTASLYPYIGGKLLTYLDEEAAIADPLISGGDLYRKTGGGVDYVNPDNVPSLDLQFSTDKSLTARRGPTPVFSRGSSGTFVNASGLIVGKTAGTTASITPNTQAIGSQVTVTVASGSVVGWVVGQAVSLIVDTDGQDDPDATELWLLGNIVSTTATQLVFEVTQRTSQPGSATSWTLGYRGPRFDHDPANPTVCRGLLIEESRTNLLQRSEEFDNTYWTPARAPQPTANSAVSPDGLTTADKLIADTTPANNHRVDRSPVTLALNTIYTVSVFAKASEYTGIALGVGLSATRGVDYSLVGAGTATPVSGAGHTGTIQQLANGWYRCTATFTSDATTALHRVAIYVGQNGTTFTYTGDNTSGIFIWGAQVEAGSFATSYIPTTTSSAVRSADVCSITGAAFTGLWSGEATVLFSAMRYQALATTASRSWALHTGTSATEIYAAKFGTQESLGIAGNTIVATGTIIPAFQQFKTAHAIKATDYAGSQNGLATITSNNAVSITPNAFNIGSGFANTGQLNGTISAIRYYRRRLSNAKLQALTV